MKKLLIISLIVLSLVLVGCKESSITGDVTVEEAIEGCKDSDGGINPDVKGMLYVGGKDYADACVSGLLIEYYCDNGNKANQNIRCDIECSNGKCI